MPTRVLSSRLPIALGKTQAPARRMDKTLPTLQDGYGAARRLSGNEISLPPSPVLVLVSVAAAGSQEERWPGGGDGEDGGTP
jgi:hypothetical protein